MTNMTKKPIKSGCDYLRDENWQPIVRTRRGAQQLADKLARRQTTPGFWNGSVYDAGDYFRISISGQQDD